MTLNLNTNYRKLIPLDSCVRFECWVLKEDANPRKVHVAGKLSSIDTGEVYSDATALFYKRQPHPSYDECYAAFGRESGITPERFVELIRWQRQQEEEQQKQKQSGKGGQEQPTAKL